MAVGGSCTAVVRGRDRAACRAGESHPDVGVALLRGPAGARRRSTAVRSVKAWRPSRGGRNRSRACAARTDRRAREARPAPSPPGNRDSVAPGCEVPDDDPEVCFVFGGQFDGHLHRPCEISVHVHRLQIEREGSFEGTRTESNAIRAVSATAVAVVSPVEHPSATLGGRRPATVDTTTVLMSSAAPRGQPAAVEHQRVDHRLVVVAPHRRDPLLLDPLECCVRCRSAVDEIADAEQPVARPRSKASALSACSRVSKCPWTSPTTKSRSPAGLAWWCTIDCSGHRWGEDMLRSPDVIGRAREASGPGADLSL